MGCGPSHLVHGEDGGSANTPRDQPKPQQTKVLSNGHPAAVKENNAKNKVMNSTDTNENRQDVITNNLPPAFPKSISFAVGMDGQEKDSLIAKHPPIKLKRLEPLNMPLLTPELLKEKQKLADEKRERELQRKKSASRKSSKRRRELMAAKDYELQQKVQEQDNSKMQSAEALRLAKLNDIKEKQKIREERAKRAREKAQRMKQAEQADLGILEVEKDDHYNADDVDSWLDGDNNTGGNQSETGDRVYSGRCSPQKQLQDTTNNRYPSASTVDSFDNAYNRKTPSASAPRQKQLPEETDDFFDS